MVLESVYSHNTTQPRAPFWEITHYKEIESTALPVSGLQDGEWSRGTWFVSNSMSVY